MKSPGDWPCYAFPDKCPISSINGRYAACNLTRVPSSGGPAVFHTVMITEQCGFGIFDPLSFLRSHALRWLFGPLRRIGCP